MPKYAPVPTLKKLHDDDRFVRAVMGPFGSGKSVGMCWEIFFRAKEQRKGPNGKRRSRWAVIRATYPELEKSTMKTWLHWFPDDKAIGHLINNIDLTAFY